MAPTMFDFRPARSRAMEQRHHALDQTSTAASTLEQAPVRSYRERHGGEGYPHSLWQDHVPLPPGMFAAARPCGPIAPDRSCRKSGCHAAVREINPNAGAQFDPTVAEAFLPANGIGLIRDNAFRQEENEERWPTNS